MAPPQLRLLVVLALAAVLVVGAAAPARADEQGARATATAFLAALSRGDAASVCSLFSAEALEKLGGADRCRRSYSESPDEEDYRATWMLDQAFGAAEKSAVKRRGQFVTKSFVAKSLARDMERIDEDLTVKLGRGPKAAVGQLATTVVLDVRSNARRLVLYVESDDGSILRMSGTMLGRREIVEVATGVPEADRPEEDALSFSIDRVTANGDGSSLVRVSVSYVEGGITIRYVYLLEVVPAGGGYAISDFFYSLISITAGP